MTLVTATLGFVLDVALGAWLGVMAFFSFVGAPRAFAVFDDRGGEYVNDVFPRYYRVGVGLGVVAFLAGLGLGAVTRYDGATLVVLAATAIATLTSVSLFGGFAAPIVAGRLIELDGFLAAFTLAGVTAALGVALSWFAPEPAASGPG